MPKQDAKHATRTRPFQSNDRPLRAIPSSTHQPDPSAFAEAFQLHIEQREAERNGSGPRILAGVQKLSELQPHSTQEGRA